VLAVCLSYNKNNVKNQNASIQITKKYKSEGRKESVSIIKRKNLANRSLTSKIQRGNGRQRRIITETTKFIIYLKDEESTY
jgi:hypothetical protein